MAAIPVKGAATTAATIAIPPNIADTNNPLGLIFSINLSKKFFSTTSFSTGSSSIMGKLSPPINCKFVAIPSRLNS